MPTTTTEPTAPASPSAAAAETGEEETTAPLSPEALESDLIAHLASTSALEDLHATLLASLQRAGWTERIRTLSLELLRAGRCQRFDDVVEAVVALAKGRSHPAVMPRNNHSHNNDTNNGEGMMNGGGDTDAADAFFENVDVRIPRAVVDEGVRAIKKALREVVDIEDDSDTEGGGDAQQQQEQHEAAMATTAMEDGGGGKDAVKTEAADEDSATALKNGHGTAAGKKAVKHKPKAGKEVKSSQ